jgi:hypothetical protein
MLVRCSDETTKPTSRKILYKNSYIMASTNDLENKIQYHFTNKALLQGVRKSVEHSLSFYAYKYSLLWNLLEKEGAVYKASLYLAR